MAALHEMYMHNTTMNGCSSVKRHCTDGCGSPFSLNRREKAKLRECILAYIAEMFVERTQVSITEKNMSKFLQHAKKLSFIAVIEPKGILL